MNILVCIKQVPDTTEIKINPETNTLMREGVPSIVNTFDAYRAGGGGPDQGQGPGQPRSWWCPWAPSRPRPP